MRTGDRLGVKTAIGGIVVFVPAVIAEDKGGHRGVGSVIGDALDYRKARPAVGAVGKGITETALLSRANFLHTFRADGQVCQDGS